MAEANRPLALRRAEQARREVEKLENQSCGHYVSYVRALPAEILQMGLGQALATQLAAARGDKKNPHRILYDQMERWLCSAHVETPFPEGKNLMNAIVEHDEATYLRAQAEALAYLEWLKKFAVAFLKHPGKGDEQ